MIYHRGISSITTFARGRKAVDGYTCTTIYDDNCERKRGDIHNPLRRFWILKASKPLPTSERGFDAGKEITGRKRHVLVDTLALIWLLVVHPANVQDCDGARLLLSSLSDFCYRLHLI